MTFWSHGQINSYMLMSTCEKDKAIVQMSSDKSFADHLVLSSPCLQVPVERCNGIDAASKVEKMGHPGHRY